MKRHDDEKLMGFAEIEKLAARQVADVQWRLKLEIKKSRLSQRDVERRLEMGRGYLTQVLGGNVDLKLEQLFKILAVIGVAPADFVVSLYGPMPTMLEALREMQERLGAAGEAAALREDGPAAQEVAEPEAQYAPAIPLSPAVTAEIQRQVQAELEKRDRLTQRAISKTARR